MRYFPSLDLSFLIIMTGLNLWSPNMGTELAAAQSAREFVKNTDVSGFTLRE